MKNYPEKETVEEFARQAARQGRELLRVELDHSIPARFKRDVWKHGQTYPDMPWSPKNRSAHFRITFPNIKSDLSRKQTFAV